MNATIVCLLAALSAQPTSEAPTIVYRLSPEFASVVRGQTPGYDEVPAGVQPPAGQTYNGTTSPPTYTPPTYSPGGSTLNSFQSPTVIDGGIAAPGAFGLYGQQAGFYAGYESVFLKPHFDSDAAFEFDQNSLGAGAGPDFQTVYEFDWDLEHSPRTWVGFAGPDGLGIQGRYWQFDHDTQRAARDPSATTFLEVEFEHDDKSLDLGTRDGEGIFARHGLEIHAIDLEGTWHRPISNTAWLMVTGGLRYVRMDQDFGGRITFTDTAGRLGAGDTEVLLASHHNFEGIGPTISLSGRRRLGLSNLALFATGRLSALYGDSAIEMRSFNFTPAGTFVEDEGWSRNGNDVLPVTEFQVGVDWWCSIWPCGRLFLRTALEAQVWFDAGTGLNTASDEHVLSPQEGNLGLLGFTVGGGLTY